MTNQLPYGKMALTFSFAALAALSLSACNQSGQANNQTASTSAPLPPPPTPPQVPQYHRTADEEHRWQQYLIMKQAYEAQLAQARREGRREQAYDDQGQQAAAFDAGRHDQASADRSNQVNAFNAGRSDQARIDQARHDLDAAYHQAQFEPDPRRRAEMIDHAKAELAAATGGH
jgi:hypothetical protein